MLGSSHKTQSKGERNGEAMRPNGALEVAVQEADEYLRKVQQHLTRGAMEDCQCYLGAVNAAIRGLEEEYDEILVEAKSCLDRPEKIGTVKERIDRYLRVHRLRRRLTDAIDGVRPIRDALQRRADQFLPWPWRRQNRRKAVNQFAKLLQDLDNYVRELEEKELKYREMGTGVAVKPLV